jgi:hypothetical protein
VAADQTGQPASWSKRAEHAYAGGVVSEAHDDRRTTRRGIAFFAGLSILMAAVQLGAGSWFVRDWQDRVHVVKAQRLSAALLTFRPSDRAGLAKPVTSADLAPERSVRTRPQHCAPLTLLAERTPVDGQSWTGISGTPAQPVNTLTVRLDDAASARRELAAKQAALLRCRSVRLTFAPFDQPEQPFVISGRRLPVPGTDHLAYALQGEKRYVFYVRRYANTLTWSYGANESAPRVRRAVVDDLVARLHDLSDE